MLRARCGFKASVFTAGVLMVALGQGMAGEPIIVGKEKPKTDAIKESKFGKELSKPWEKVSPESPMNGLIFPSIIPRGDAWDPKGERKRKLQEREKKNWMSVLPGELQQEEETKNFLGVREYAIEREDESDNLMFRELRGDRNSQGNSRTGTRGSEKENQDGSHRNDAEDLERELAARRAARMETRGTESQGGAHTANELNFKGLFGNGPAEGKSSELTLRDVLGGSEQQANKNQQAMREEFKAFLHGTANNQGTMSSGFSDPVQTSRSDFTRQPLNPAISRPQQSRTETFAGQPGFTPSRPASPFGGSGFSDNSIARPGIPGFPSPSYSPNAPSVPRSFQTAPPVRRGFGDTLGGHR